MPEPPSVQNPIWKYCCSAAFITGWGSPTTVPSWAALSRFAGVVIQLSAAICAAITSTYALRFFARLLLSTPYISYMVPGLVCDIFMTTCILPAITACGALLPGRTSGLTSLIVSPQDLSIEASAVYLMPLMASTVTPCPLSWAQEVTAGSVETTTQSGTSWPWMPTSATPFAASSISWAGGMIAMLIWPSATPLVASVPVWKLRMVTLTPYFL